MQLIISNTTEVGIVLDENDRIGNNPPSSFQESYWLGFTIVTLHLMEA
jgi:hypothetical protein